MRNRFYGGLSLTGRECRALMPALLTDHELPCPLHQAALSFCHIAHLIYGSSEPLPPTGLQRVGMPLVPLWCVSYGWLADFRPFGISQLDPPPELAIEMVSYWLNVM